MLLTRYTCGGIGIFKGPCASLVNLVSDYGGTAEEENEVVDAYNEFERYMRVPNVVSSTRIDTISWFTEEGIEKFKDCLETIIFYANIYLDCPVVIEHRELDEKPLYKDEYQVIFAKGEVRM